MSDCLIPMYMYLEKKFKLHENLKFLIVNTGPGSFTALRIGIAFLSGLGLSKNIKLIGISCCDLFRYFINKKYLPLSVIYILSSNDQKFICTYSKIHNNYLIEKNNNHNKFIENDSNFKNIYTNANIELNLKNEKKYNQVYFKDIVKNNLQTILSKYKYDIIKPIYVSNNPVLN
jgi:tRNA A37 threonylcarbamoyladenosine modification protein TsaB